MYCKKCGQVNGSDQKNCIRCGAPLQDEKELQDQELREDPWDDDPWGNSKRVDPYAPGKGKGSGKTGFYVLCGLGAFLLFAVIIGIVRIQRSVNTLAEELSEAAEQAHGSGPDLDVPDLDVPDVDIPDLDISDIAGPDAPDWMKEMIEEGLELGEKDEKEAAGTGKDQKKEEIKGAEKASGKTQEVKASLPAPLSRPAFMKKAMDISAAVTASVPEYRVEPGLSNVIDVDAYYLSPEKRALLEKQYFYVIEGGPSEYFETYESNRYNVLANFVTVDSMMHTYHLYFSHLLKNTERNYLSKELRTLSEGMLNSSLKQYETLRGTEWEKAAFTNVVFFGTGLMLQDGTPSLPAEAQAAADAEIRRIMAHSGVEKSDLTGEDEDYSQYIVRGYYEGIPELESYFRAMMWYGRLNFLQNKEDLDRSALLITMALDQDEDLLQSWSEIYSITSFFAGASDDNSYYEYQPFAKEAYGSVPEAGQLPGASDAWAKYREMTALAEPPKINSVPADLRLDGDVQLEASKGFRFMGQRFSVDGAIFQQLLDAGEDPAGDKRTLPDALEIPAALGSQEAMKILDQRGVTRFERYGEKMDLVQKMYLNEDSALWQASLYSGWLNTLRPLLTEKGEGYPMFMRSAEWQRKDLQTFLGSYTELKHDTVLYAKQVMVEMGGGDIPRRDDRGYVEPEPLVYERLASLTRYTKEGLLQYGLLSAEDEENLGRLQTLAEQLQLISEKELKNELPTEEEFELIRTYGGQLEHFWEEVYRHETDKEHFSSREFPAAVVTDIATYHDQCLEVGTGDAGTIYVVVPVDGKLKIASGAVFSFYQFPQPSSDRLTDTKWRQMLGIELDDSGSYQTESAFRTEDWTDGFQFTYRELQ